MCYKSLRNVIIEINPVPKIDHLGQFVISKFYFDWDWLKQNNWKFTHHFSMISIWNLVYFGNQGCEMSSRFEISILTNYQVFKKIKIVFWFMKTVTIFMWCQIEKFKQVSFDIYLTKKRQSIFQVCYIMLIIEDHLSIKIRHQNIIF